MPVIDVHTHFLSPELVYEARAEQAPDDVRTESASGQEWIVHRQGFRYPPHRTFYEMAARLAAMTTSGTDTGILADVSLNADDRDAIAPGNAALLFPGGA